MASDSDSTAQPPLPWSMVFAGCSAAGLSIGCVIQGEHLIAVAMAILAAFLLYAVTKEMAETRAPEPAAVSTAQLEARVTQLEDRVTQIESCPGIEGDI